MTDNSDNVVVLDSSIEDALNFDGLRLLAVADSQEARVSIGSYLTGFDGIEYELMTRSDFAQKGVVVASETPDILLIEVDNEKEAIEQIEAIRGEEEYEFLHICLLMSKPSKNAIVKLMRHGADDILSLTPNEVELSGSLARSASQRGMREGSGGKMRRHTIVFLHASGGAGATTLAVNSAVQLHEEAKKSGSKACLIDLDLQFGDVDLQLDLPMRSNLIDVIKSPDRLDHRMLENLMITGPNGLNVLTAPEQPLPMDAFDKKTIEKIISLARRHHRYVVIDMPIALTSWTDCILQNADHIFLVTQVNVIALRSSRRLIDTLQTENLGHVPITAIANRYPNKGQGKKISVAQAEKMLLVPFLTKIPNDFGALINSLDQGMPLSIQQPTSGYAKNISQMLEKAEVTTSTSQKKRGLNVPFFKRGSKDV